MVILGGWVFLMSEVPLYGLPLFCTCNKLVAVKHPHRFRHAHN